MVRSYILCATPRSGSTLLCDLLAATGRAGAPDSFFMRDVAPEWARAWGLPDGDGADDLAWRRAFLSAVLAAGRGGTDVFGLRLMHENLADVAAFLAPLHPGVAGDAALIAAAFGPVLYLHLSRRDKLAQAVSRVRAEQTGLWHIAPDGTELERLSPPQPPVYDHARIARELAALDQADAAWNDWFAEQGIAPLRLAYEDLAADPAGTLARVCRALDLPPPDPATVRPGTARLADATSQEWMQRFRAEAGDACR